MAAIDAFSGVEAKENSGFRVGQIGRFGKEDQLEFVIPGLDPGIHAVAGAAGIRFRRADARVKPGHDDLFWAEIQACCSSC